MEKAIEATTCLPLEQYPKISLIDTVWAETADVEDLIQ